jgi:hypothetical protein
MLRRLGLSSIQVGAVGDGEPPRTPGSGRASTPGELAVVLPQPPRDVERDADVRSPHAPRLLADDGARPK